MLKTQKGKEMRRYLIVTPKAFHGLCTWSPAGFFPGQVIRPGPSENAELTPNPTIWGSGSLSLLHSHL